MLKIEHCPKSRKSFQHSRKKNYPPFTWGEDEYGRTFAKLTKKCSKAHLVFNNDGSTNEKLPKTIVNALGPSPGDYVLEIDESMGSMESEIDARGSSSFFPGLLRSAQESLKKIMGRDRQTIAGKEEQLDFVSEEALINKIESLTNDVENLYGQLRESDGKLEKSNKELRESSTRERRSIDKIKRLEDEHKRLDGKQKRTEAENARFNEVQTELEIEHKNLLAAHKEVSERLAVQGKLLEVTGDPEKIAELREEIERLEAVREEVYESMSLKDKVKYIFKKYGVTVVGVLAAVGTVIGVIVSNLKAGLAKVAKGLGNGLKELGKKLGQILPGMVGAIVSFLFRAAGEAIGFLAKHAWILILLVVTFVVEQFKKRGEKKK